MTNEQPTQGVPVEAYLTDEEIDTIRREVLLQLLLLGSSGREAYEAALSRAVSNAATEKVWHSRDAEVAELRKQLDALVEVAKKVHWDYIDSGERLASHRALLDALSQVSGGEERESGC